MNRRANRRVIFLGLLAVSVLAVFWLEKKGLNHDVNTLPIETTLPVISLTGRQTARCDDEGRIISEGTITLWTERGTSGSGCRVQTEQAEWHVRGATSSAMRKRPWKIKVTDANGEKKNVDLAGLGRDDDWILNPMSFDDTKIREKMAMDLWNSFTGSGGGMSSGEYVEVVINGEYQGVYLLQRRIDRKYLPLDPGRDILFKGVSVWKDNTIQERYRIEYSPFGAEQTYVLLQDVLDEGRISLESFADTSLFLQFLGAYDNMGYKNMYYVLRYTQDGYWMEFIPWDTDVSMGILWDEMIQYDAQRTMESLGWRLEYDAMEARYPNHEAHMAQRWKALRKDMYEEETIVSYIDRLHETLMKSGALERDAAKWGFYSGGMDTWESLRQWCLDRLNMMDAYYTDQTAE